MRDQVKMNENAEPVLKVYKMRWVVLTCTSILFCFTSYLELMFGTVNNVMVAFFQVTYTEMDWTTLSVLVSCILVLVVLAYSALDDLIDLKLTLVVGSMSFLINGILNALGFINSKLFPVIILGQIISGILNASITVMIAKVGAIWFPESQIGIVMGIGMMSWNLGVFLAEVIPENIFQNPSILYSFDNVSQNVMLENTTTELSKHWFKHDKLAAQIFFTVSSCVALAILFVVAVFVPRLPKYPPSKSQAFKLLYLSKNNKKTFKVFLCETKSILGDYTFVLLQIVLGLTVQTFVLESVLIVQIIDPIRSRLNVNLTSNMIGGYVIAFRCFGDVIGSYVSGKLLDKYRSYRYQIIAGTFGTLLPLSLFVVSWYFASIAGLFTSMFFLGIISYFSVVPLHDSIVQHTYPKNIIFVVSWAGVLRFFITIVITTAGRQVYEYTDAFGVLLFHCLLQLIGFALSFFVNPKLKRQEEERKTNNSELSPLIAPEQ